MMMMIMMMIMMIMMIMMMGFKLQTTWYDFMCFVDMVADDPGIAAQLYRKTHETWQTARRNEIGRLPQGIFIRLMVIVK